MYLHWCQLYGGNVGGVHHGLGPIGSVCQEALPLLWQAGELLLPWVEARVDPVLEVRRSWDLQPFLLLPKHAGKPWQTWQPQKKKKHTCINILAAALVTLMFDTRELKTVSLRCRYEVIMAVYSPSCLKFNLLFYIVLGCFTPPLCSMMNLLSYNAAGYRWGKNEENYPNTQNKRKKAKCPLWLCNVNIRGKNVLDSGSMQLYSQARMLHESSCLCFLELFGKPTVTLVVWVYA